MINDQLSDLINHQSSIYDFMLLVVYDEEMF